MCASSSSHFRQCDLEILDSTNVHEGLWEAIVNMHVAIDRLVIQSMTRDDIFALGVQLLAMPPIVNATERQQFLDAHMTKAKYSLVNKPKNADITAKTQRGKVEVKKRHFFREAQVSDEAGLNPIEFGQGGSTSVANCTILIFD